MFWQKAKARLQACPEGESEQALVRVLLLGIVLAYFIGFHGWRNQWTVRDAEIVRVVGGFLLFAVAIVAGIGLHPRPSVLRRLLAMFADVTLCTWYMAVAEEFGFFALGLYLFVALGYGFRYGRRYLFLCQFLCLAGMTWVLLSVPFWEARRIAGFGLLTTLIALPLYVSALLRAYTGHVRSASGNVSRPGHPGKGDRLDPAP